MKWRTGLTKKQKAHLREMKIRTKGDFITARAQQNKDIAAERARQVEHGLVLTVHAESLVGCWECKEIAKRLGLEE